MAIPAPVGAVTAPGAGADVAAVSALSVTFRRDGRSVQAVRGVDLTIRRGEILGLVGESGSGKSVLGLSLLGLLAAGAVTSGSATVLGTNMLSAPTAQRRRVRRTQLGAVFQDPMTSLNPTMRVGRQVAEAAGSGKEAARLLSLVGVPDAERRLSSFPHELSGGLRQRVMIAMAVAGDPALVVADEPTTALDVTVQAQVLGLIQRLRDEVGCAFLLITHDLGVAAQVADRVAVMYAGRLAEVGETATVLHRAAHPYSAALTRSRLSLATDATRPLVALPGEVPSPVRPEPGCAFAPRCPLAHDACLVTPPDCVDLTPDADLDAGADADGLVEGGHRSACLLPPATVRAGLSFPRAGADDVAVTTTTTEPGAEPTGDPVAVDDDAADDGGHVAVDDDTADTFAIAARDVARTFVTRQGLGAVRRLQALRGASLTVARGEAVAVVGESGSGKSTLLRIIAGLETSNGGEVRLGSTAGAQMVFQDAGASLTPWLTVGELIEERLRAVRVEGARLDREQRRAKVHAALAAVGLPAEVAGARAGQLSGGQRQRVALARATVVPPEVLLCDEPTSALDVSLAASVLNLVSRLRRELGMAVVFVTHDLAVARIVADRIAVMYLGRIVEIGSADDVTHRPRHPYTKALVAAVPDVGVRLGGSTGEPASALAPPPGCSFNPRCPLADDACRDPELEPRLARAPGDSTRLVACIHPDIHPEAHSDLQPDAPPDRGPAVIPFGRRAPLDDQPAEVE